MLGINFVDPVWAKFKVKHFAHYVHHFSFPVFLRKQVFAKSRKQKTLPRGGKVLLCGE
jgi:hypothetical protein